MLAAAWASIACIIVVIVALGVRGTSDWSETFAVFWFGTWAAAAVFAVIAIVEAASPARGNAEGHQRLLAVALGIATLAISGLIVAMIISILSSVR